jgi:hypothetical protein
VLGISRYQHQRLKKGALRRHSESGHSKMVVERESKLDAGALHDGKAGCIDGRELV